MNRLQMQGEIAGSLISHLAQLAFRSQLKSECGCLQKLFDVATPDDALPCLLNRRELRGSGRIEAWTLPHGNVLSDRRNITKAALVVSTNRV